MSLEALAKRLQKAELQALLSVENEAEVEDENQEVAAACELEQPKVKMQMSGPKAGPWAEVKY